MCYFHGQSCSGLVVLISRDACQVMPMWQNGVGFLQRALYLMLRVGLKHVNRPVVIWSGCQLLGSVFPVLHNYGTLIQKNWCIWREKDWWANELKVCAGNAEGFWSHSKTDARPGLGTGSTKRYPSDSARKMLKDCFSGNPTTHIDMDEQNTRWNGDQMIQFLPAWRVVYWWCLFQGKVL